MELLREGLSGLVSFITFLFPNFSLREKKKGCIKRGVLVSNAKEVEERRAVYRTVASMAVLDGPNDQVQTGGIRSTHRKLQLSVQAWRVQKSTRSVHG